MNIFIELYQKTLLSSKPPADCYHKANVYAALNHILFFTYEIQNKSADLMTRFVTV